MMASRFIFSVGLTLLCATTGLSAAEAANTIKSFKSVDVDLPFGDRMFPDGPGSDAISNNCLACHSAAMVLNQPPLPRATWQSEVDKMRASYKAPISDEDAASIVDYLARIKGAH
jgi:cytochrome c553